MANFLSPGYTYANLKTNYVNQSLGITFHFNINTFTDTDYTDGTDSPNVFNPSALNIDQWMQCVIDAKANYAYLTTKHIGGFCLWPTTTTSYNITASDWYSTNGNIDIVDLFVTKCREYNIIPMLYLCVKDNNFEATFPSATQAEYRSFTQSQLIELLTNYGRVGGVIIDAANTIFFPAGNDGYPWASAAEMDEFIRGRQRQAMVLGNFNATSDIVLYEGANYPGLFVPDGNTTPAESWETIYSNGSPSSWFWKSTTPTLRSTSTLISNIALANSRTSTYNINVPPDITGAIESRMVTVMQAIGAR